MIPIILAFNASGALAINMELYDWSFNIDGNMSENLAGDEMPVTGELTDGLGTLSWSTGDAGNHSFLAFFDHQIDADINTFFNEYGDAGGLPESGQEDGGTWLQSWEIDEPGWVFGDIYNNVLNGALDNTNGVPSGSEDDVSMALGWGFTLNEGYRATIDLFIRDTAPEAGFYMAHCDPDSNAAVYVSGDINYEPVPEPGTIVLVSLGLIMLGFGRKRFKQA